MPDHLHLFVQRASSGTIPLKRWMGWWKRDFSVALQLGSSIWQTDFWDTRIRSEAHYHAKWLYVRNNPVRHAAVRLPDEWEYQGEIYVLKA
jgi:REP element-mobilizing transposase RayT